VTVAAVVLAAGAATRYGGPKQRELLPAVLAALSQTDVSPIVVVEGAWALEPRSNHVPTTFEPRSNEVHGVTLVHCEDWAEGPGASLRCGLAALGDEVTHALVVLADGPELDPRAVSRLVEQAGDAPVAAATYDGSRSHPVLLARSAWSTLPSEGGRALAPLLVDCSDLRPPGDVDYRP
jgi:CTP:molybdopterin cytidylyltransferase MocA